MPFITGDRFRLSFPDKGSDNIEVAVGKISVGYYDVNGEKHIAIKMFFQKKN